MPKVAGSNPVEVLEPLTILSVRGSWKEGGAVTQTKTSSFSIRVLAQRYGVSPESIRNWEREGRMPPARRTPGGHRRYGPEHQAALDALIVPCADDQTDGKD